MGQRKPKAAEISADDDLDRRDKPARKRIRLSQEIIVAEAAAMLSEGTLEALTLRGLAERLGAGPMSLYTYYRSRDALLNAVAEYVFAQFEPPARNDPWQDYVRDWLMATHRHFIRHPIAPKIIIWDGHVASAWLKTWIPVAEILKAQGLQGARLAFAMEWFSLTAMGFISAHIDAPNTRQPNAVANVADLDRHQQRLAAELWLNFQDVDHNAMFEFGIDNIVQGLETIIATDAAIVSVVNHGAVEIAENKNLDA